MAMRKKHAEHENHERWLVSYADFITLLFAFFVVMFATSQTDKSKAKQMSESVSKALEEGSAAGVVAAVAKVLGGTVDDKGQGNAMMRGPGGAQRAAKDSPPEEVAELLPSLKLLTKELEEDIKHGNLELSMEPRGLIVSLKQAAFFPSGEDTVDAKTYPTLQKLADLMKKLPNPVRLEGHTDSVPIRTARFRSNWELSAARGIAMLEILSSRLAVPRERLAIVGYAETAPVDSNTTAAGRARNRRVDIVILNILGRTPVDKPAAPAKATKAAPAKH